MRKLAALRQSVSGLRKSSGNAMNRRGSGKRSKTKLSVF